MNSGSFICGTFNFLPVYGLCVITFNPGPSNYLQIGTQKLAFSQNLPAVQYVYAGVNTGLGTNGNLHASNIANAAGSGVSLTPGVLKNNVRVDDVTGNMPPGGIPATRLAGGI